MSKHKFTHPLKAREGHRWRTLKDHIEVTNVHYMPTDPKKTGYSICGVFEGHIELWTEKGKYYKDLDYNKFDLEDIPPDPIERYINIYEDPEYDYEVTMDGVYLPCKKLARIKIKFNEGDGLDD